METSVFNDEGVSGNQCLEKCFGPSVIETSFRSSMEDLRVLMIGLL